jgi:hypothetical protein
MKKMRFLTKLIGLALIFAIPVLLLIPNIGNTQPLEQPIKAYDIKIIKIYAERAFDQIVTLEPRNLIIKKDTVVVFSNLTGRSPVKVSFRDGKVCDACTTSACRFAMTSDNCFAATLVSSGQTASLCFMKEGTFVYDVIVVGQAIKGTIIVKAPKEQEAK